MSTFQWSISQMDRLTSDGFVITVHYRVNAVDGEYQASTYGTTSYTQDQDTFIPYDQLTEAEVVGWVQTSLGKDTVESSLQSQIDLLKHPTQANGIPWSTK
jgi:hypothetical protein